jgi:hypothetical protein
MEFFIIHFSLVCFSSVFSAIQTSPSTVCSQNFLNLCSSLTGEEISDVHKTPDSKEIKTFPLHAM